MGSSAKQMKIPFSERKLWARNNVTPSKSASSEEETSPLKYKLYMKSESKIVLRRSFSKRSHRAFQRSPKGSSATPRKRNTPCRINKPDIWHIQELDHFATPSKRKRFESDEAEENVPCTENNCTPSSLLSNLHLSSEGKKNKVVCLDEDFKTPRSAVQYNELLPSTSSARKALYTCTNSLPCREEEISKLLNLLEKHLEEQTCGSVYIAGLPGTGKTASIDHVIKSEKIAKGYKIVKINCTSFSFSCSIYKRICDELRIKIPKNECHDKRVLIEKYLLRRHKMILLILDEIDQLETRSQSVLYKIFEWPSLKKARLVLIGIANAMDLTDRILPRLCAKVELKPVLLHFPPYTKSQIQKILSHRLSEVGANDVFTPSAIELISAKVAGMSGDIRRALDLGRRVVEVTEESKGTKKSPVKEVDENILNDFLRLSNRHCSPNKINISGEKYSISDRYHKFSDESTSSKSREATPLKNSDVSLLKENSIIPGLRSRKKLFGDEYEENGPILREIKLNEVAFTPRDDNEMDKFPQKIIPPRSPFSKKECSYQGVHTLSPVKNHSYIGNENISSNDISSGHKSFSVDSKDVLDVMKNVYGSSKTLKSKSDDTSFPLHQKLMLCTFLLISKKGKVKDLNIGKLHQVYTKICLKRGITPVDQSGFLFLCRQVEMTGIMQIGKGHGKLAKISLQWDEAEVTDAMKDLNLLSSILDDVSCL